MTKRSASRCARTSIVILTGILGACSGSSAIPEHGRFGPLSVIEDSGGGQSDALGGTGRVIIGDRCVELEVQGRRRLLVWRSADVRWDAAARAIVFAPREQRPIAISNNLTITVGGEDLPTDAPADNVRWLAAPDRLCSTDVFIVHSIRTAR